MSLTTSDNTEDTTRRISERIRDCISLWVVTKAKGTRSSITDPSGPVWVDSSGVPTRQPGLWVDTSLLHLGLEPLPHLLVVGLEERVLAGEATTGAAGVAEPLLLDHVDRGGGSRIPVDGTEERTLCTPAVGDRLRQ